MPAYWLARSKIVDPVEYKKYTDLVPKILKKHGGIVLARGAQSETLEGPDTFERFVVVEFPTFEAATVCFNSEEYSDAAKFRRSGAGINELTIVDAGDTTK